VNAEQKFVWETVVLLELIQEYQSASEWVQEIFGGHQQVGMTWLVH
jgi:hypothetical protein